MKVRDQQRRCHSSAQRGGCIFVLNSVQASAWVCLSAQVYLFAKGVPWCVFLLCWCRLDPGAVCVFATANFLVSFFFFWWSAVWFVSECLSSRSWEFAAESQHSISLPSRAILASFSTRVPPVGCTVAEGSKRGFYPSWTASHKVQLLLPWLLLFLRWNTVVSKWYKYDLAY